MMRCVLSVRKVWPVTTWLCVCVVFGAAGETMPALANETSAGEFTVHRLQPGWRFAPDPENAGVSRKWFAEDFDDSKWATVRTDRGNGWESQGFPGYTGYGWYRLSVDVPADLAGEYLYLSFEAVDEDAWVYANGRLAFDHSCAAMGLTPNEMWIKPFAFEVGDSLTPGRRNVLAVRVHNIAYMGGIWKPVYLFAGDVKLDPDAFVNLHERPAVVAAVKSMKPGAAAARIALADLAWAVRMIGVPETGRRRGRRTCSLDVQVHNFTPAKGAVEFHCLPVGGAEAGQKTIVRTLQIEGRTSRTLTVEFPVRDQVSVATVETRLNDPRVGRCVFDSSFYLDLESLNWKPHAVRRADGRGGYTVLPAKSQMLRRFEGLPVIPYGLASMDNGEIAVTGAARNEATAREQGVIAFSRDGGASWTDFVAIEGFTGRPVMTTYLGNGELYFYGHLSRDYGRTWETIAHQNAANGGGFWMEGNALVDRDGNGVATRVGMTGWHYEGDRQHPRDPATCMFRWSFDRCRTWQNEVSPEEWFYDAEFAGKSYPRGNSEGAVVRAANGWIVAALRSDMPPRYFDLPTANDSLEGTAISISRDDGKTWSPLNFLFDAGRHHGNLFRLPNDDLVLTVIRRVDVRDGNLATYQRGCDAIVSSDNGLTWDVDRMYVLDEFPYCESDNWVDGQCGHLASIPLDDGSVLTVYGNYLAGGVLIRWTP